MSLSCGVLELQEALVLSNSVYNPQPPISASRISKCTHGLIIVALNIGVDPPDSPGVQSHTHSWWRHDTSSQPQKTIKYIGARYQQQFERWFEKARFKQLLDPTPEDVRKSCVSIRRAAGSERCVLFYNGHGVPRPTSNGELWAFNPDFTQYVPISLFDVQSWLGYSSDQPTLLVLDCHSAAMALQLYCQFFRTRRIKDLKRLRQPSSSAAAAAAAGGPVSPPPARTSVDPVPEELALQLRDEESLANNIILAACDADETLPCML